MYYENIHNCNTCLSQAPICRKSLVALFLFWNHEHCLQQSNWSFLTITFKMLSILSSRNILRKMGNEVNKWDDFFFEVKLRRLTGSCLVEIFLDVSLTRMVFIFRRPEAISTIMSITCVVIKVILKVRHRLLFHI